MNSNFRIKVKRKKKEHPRILLEWKKGTGKINRISIPITIRSLSKEPKIRVTWGWKKKSIKRIEMDTLTTFTDLNQFLNSLAFENFEAVKVTISYPESMHEFLLKNEKKEKSKSLIF